MIYYVYVLQSVKDNHFYTGMTNDLKRRILDHNSGRVFSTKPRIPFRIIYYEVSFNKKDAEAREKIFKIRYGKKIY